ncbi:MAG: peptidoglycan editing factor PgeF [Burkholderiales bacterium]|nr:peptidoglycan editing factor PgeF [Burkholderiales bacterium]
MNTNPLFITANWNAPKHVKTLITTRIGGVSTGNYNSFNLAMDIGDNSQLVLQNRQILNSHLPHHPYWLKQIHSNQVIHLEQPGITAEIIPEADASITLLPQNVCVVMTGDCLPILLTDIMGSFVAAVHAGWKGLYKEIIVKTLKLSQTNPQNILAYIGPSICQKHYEVNEELFKLFTNLDKENAHFFIDKPHKKFDCNLTGIAKLQLIQHGVLEPNIFMSNECTYCNEELFYSYRRNNITGRFASCIWLSDRHIL